MSTEASPALVALTRSVGIDERQVLLLRACLLRGEPAVDAWRRWIAGADLEDVDRGSARLLPLLWHNLVANGVEDRRLPLLKGVYRHTWFGNQVWLTKLAGLQALLDEAGVSVLVLKGTVLAHRSYASPGLRPMDDLDILVRPADVPAAVAALRRAGWQTPMRDPIRLLRVVAGTEFMNDAGDRVDLHGHVMGAMRDDLDERRWARSVWLEAAGVRFRALDETDQLLHVIAHGARSEEPAIRWVADAWTIMERAGPAIDWRRFVEDAETEWYGLTMIRALTVLRERFDAPIPPAVIQAFRRRARTRVERLDDRLAHGLRIFFVGRLVRRWTSYRRWRRAPDPMRARTGFVGYLQHVWEVPTGRAMPVHVVRHAADRLRLDTARALRAARPRTEA